MLILLNGGLGNQIGNYVFGRYLEIFRGINVKFVFAQKIEGDRNFVLDKFNVNLKKAKKEDIEAFLGAPSSFLLILLLFKNVFDKIWQSNLWGFLKRVRAEYGVFPKKNLKTLSKILLFKDVLEGQYDTVCGNCYSPIEEFNDVEFKKIIREEISLKEELSGKNKEVLREIRGCKNSVGIHIRRGDYLKYKIPVIKKEFLLEKIRFFKENFEGAKFFVFSNGMDWAKEVLFGVDDVYFCNINDEEGGHFDFCLFGACKHRIYSISTFSLWAKYLNDYEESVEFLPEDLDLEK